MIINLCVNGREHSVQIEPQERLLDVLRNKLRLTGAKEGCGEGECGACTVIMDGDAVNSCTVLAYQARDSKILTIEGLAAQGEQDIIQKAFINNGAIQCGYCTPGMILSAKALLLKNPKPSETEIRSAIAGNICRCTGYVNIIKAIQQAAAQLSGEGQS
jgi:aerobic-type carbon monoxide dehydrogenase small subunit (CoxS/CutS family)